MDIIFEPRGAFLLASATGTISLREAIDSCRKMCDFAARLRVRKILFDCLALDGDLSADERFELGKTIAEYCQMRLKVPAAVAVIGKSPSVTGLCVKIAANRGMPVEMFSDRELGLEWLRSRP